MKKIPLLVLSVLITLTPALALAEDGAPASADVSGGAQVETHPPKPPRVPILPILYHFASTTKNDVKDLRDDRHGSSTPEDRQEDRQTVQHDLKVDAHLAVGLVVRNGMVRYHTLLDAYIHRLQDLITRVTHRADELDQKGQSTVDARTHLSTATTELTAAGTDLDQIKAEVDANATVTASASTTPDMLREKVKHAGDLMKDAREHIRKAFDEIRAAIKSLRVGAKAAGDADADAQMN